MLEWGWRTRRCCRHVRLKCRRDLAASCGNSGAELRVEAGQRWGSQILILEGIVPAWGWKVDAPRKGWRRWEEDWVWNLENTPGFENKEKEKSVKTERAQPRGHEAGAWTVP